MPRYSLGGGGGGTAAVTALNNATANELVTVGSTTTELDAETALTFDGSDMKLLEAVNDGNPSISIGGADAERLVIQAKFDSGAQTLESVEFATAAASGTADRGKMVFDVDGTVIMTIDDGGVNIGTGSLETATIDYTDGDLSMTIADGGGVTFAQAVDLGSNTLTTTGSLQVRTIDYSDGDNAITIADGGGMTMAQDVTMAAGKNVVLGDGSSVNISAPLLAGGDHTYSGTTAQMLAGGTIAAFDLVCIHTTTGEVVEADASAIGTARVIGIAPAAISDTATGTILLHGFIRDDTWNWTTGAVLFLSETAGAMTETAPTTDGAFVQAVGIALEPDVVFIKPSLDLIEHA